MTLQMSVYLSRHFLRLTHLGILDEAAKGRGDVEDVMMSGSQLKLKYRNSIIQAIGKEFDYGNNKWQLDY